MLNVRDHFITPPPNNLNFSRIKVLFYRALRNTGKSTPENNDEEELRCTLEHLEYILKTKWGHESHKIGFRLDKGKTDVKKGF
jgi:hypothetical protein